MADYTIKTTGGDFQVKFDRDLTPEERQQIQSMSIPEIQKRYGGGGTASDFSASNAATQNPPPESITDRLLGGAHQVGRFAKTAIGETILQPAAEYNRVGYEVMGERLGFKEPKRFKEEKRGTLVGRLFPEQVEKFPEDVPHGFLEHVGAVMSPFEAGFLVTPGGRAVFGLETVARTWVGDKLADAVAFYGGGALLAKDMVTYARIGRQKYGPFTRAEREYRAAKVEETKTITEAQKAQDTANEIRAHALDSEAQAQTMAKMSNESAGARVAEAEKVHEIAISHVGELEERAATPVKAIRDKMGLLADGPTAEYAGRVLQATDEEAQRLSASSKTAIGVPAAIRNASVQVDKAVDSFVKIGTDQKLSLPSKGTASAERARRVATQYLRGLIDGQGSRSERTVGAEIAMLGVDGVMDARTGEVTRGSPMKLWRLREKNRNLVLNYKPGGIPVNDLVNQWQRANSIALSPREFPVSRNVAKKQFTMVANQLEKTISALSTADPELHNAWLKARSQARDVYDPLVQAGKPILQGTATKRGAFKTLMGDDPTMLEEIWKHGKDDERYAYAHAGISDLVDSATKNGVTDYKKLVKEWEKYPEETRRILSSFNNGAVKMVMDEAITHVNELDAATERARLAGKEAGAAKKAATAAEAAGKAKLTEVKEWQEPILKRADEDFHKTLDALAKAQVKVERLGEIKRSAGPKTIKAAKEAPPVLRFIDVYGEGITMERMDPHDLAKGAGQNYRMMAKAHTVLGLVDALHGNMTRAVLQGGEAKLFMRGKLVREALETPIETPRGQEIAAALNAMLHGYLAQPVDTTTQDEGYNAPGPSLFRGNQFRQNTTP